MDNDKSYYRLVSEVETEIKEHELSPEAAEKVRYEKAMKGHLEEDLDSRILRFQQRPPAAREGRYPCVIY